MKNIYIIGTPRSGKTTLARLIKEKYPIYNQISFEAVRNGFIETQPELNMNNRNSVARKNILPKHIVSLAHYNSKISNNPSLVEGSFCTIKNLYGLIDENDLVICLGLGCRSLEEIVDGIIDNDEEKDYTKNWTKEQIKKHFYNIVDEDKENYSYCIENNIMYYDTYKNRKDIFYEILNYISDINNR